jgi:hypothetical protein
MLGHNRAAMIQWSEVSAGMMIPSKLGEPVTADEARFLAGGMTQF